MYQKLLKVLMKKKGISQNDVTRHLRTPAKALVSEVLSGKRNFTQKQIDKVSTLFSKKDSNALLSLFKLNKKEEELKNDRKKLMTKVDAVDVKIVSAKLKTEKKWDKIKHNYIVD